DKRSNEDVLSPSTNQVLSQVCDVENNVPSTSQVEKVKMSTGNIDFEDHHFHVKVSNRSSLVDKFKKRHIMVTEVTNEFEVKGRIAWIEVEGVPFRLWTRNTFAQIADKWGWVPDFMDDTEDDDINSMDEGDAEHRPDDFDINNDEEKVPDTCFEEEAEVKSPVDEKNSKNNLENSEYPFNIQGLKYPTGFTSIARDTVEVRPDNIVEANDAQSECCEANKLKGNGNSSISSGHFKVFEAPRSGGSIIGLLEEVVKVGQVMGFKMDRCISNMEEIIGSQGMTGKKIMIIAIYAPQESKEKKSLWDFLQHEIGKWNRDVIIMGDFNEVRCKSDRFGSHYNHHGAQRCNLFILNAGLVEVNLGEMDGFQKFVENTWKSSSNEGPNALLILMNKLRLLKKQIRIWNKDNMGCRRKEQHQLKKDLGKSDSNIDSGRGQNQWAIDGDENTGFYHGIINKRRSIQNIRGIMVEGKWIDEPDMVKKELLDHFTNRFCKPVKSTASIDANFPNQLDSDQRSFLERDVTNAEIKKAVWECGTDKAPGPDGFSFGFFRHFWYLVDADVYAAVRYFFTHCDLLKGSNSSFIALIPKIPDANMGVLLMKFNRLSLKIDRF
nr:RNA-directed DNA polymerase, eukaryota [Tanacetum cinerariifolium]